MASSSDFLESRRVMWIAEPKGRSCVSPKFSFRGQYSYLELRNDERHYVLNLHYTPGLWSECFYTVLVTIGERVVLSDVVPRRLDLTERHIENKTLWECDKSNFNKTSRDSQSHDAIRFVLYFYDSAGSASSSKAYFRSQNLSTTAPGNRPQFISLTEQRSISKMRVLPYKLLQEQSAQTPPYMNVAPCLEKLSGDFRKLLHGDSCKDLELKCGDLTVLAHRSVLSVRSPVFEAMLQSDMAEGRTRSVQIQDMDGDILQLFIQYLYTGSLPELTMHVAQCLYEAGDKYLVEGLARRCADFLKENLTPENACQLLTLSDAHSDRDFKETVVRYILDNKIPFRNDQWLDFSGNHPKLALEVYHRFCKLLSAE